MKNILYTTDYSENSVPALMYAVEISKQLDARLNVLHVFDYPTVLGTRVSEPFPELGKDAVRAHRKRLEEFLGRHLGKTAKGVVPDILVLEHASAVKGILDKARELKADLVIVGMKGGSGLRETLLGSVARGLIEKSPCPVLAIPADSSYNGIQTFVYGANLELADRTVLKQLSALVSPFKATIRAVHFSPGGDVAEVSNIHQFKEALKHELPDIPIDFTTRVAEDVFDALRVYAGDENADILVMLEHKDRPFFKSLFQKDLVKKMEAYGRIPLLAFNENNLNL